MTTKKNSKPAPALARYADVEASALIASYCDWIEEQTGRRPDPWSVYVGSQLRGKFQKSEGNQKRLAEQAARLAEEAKAKAARKAEREKAAQAKAAAQDTTPATPKAKPAPKVPAKGSAQRAAKPATPAAKPAPKPTRRRRGATVATESGVVVAEQRHIDATEEVQA